MIRLILIILGFSTVISGIVYLLSKLKNKTFKFIPSMLLFILSLFFIIKSKSSSITWEDLGYILLFMITISSSLITLIVAFLFNKIKK